jgi:hypothetical protein
MPSRQRERQDRRGPLDNGNGRHQTIDASAASIAQLAKETAGMRPAWMGCPDLLPRRPPPLPRTESRPARRSDDPGR